MPKGGIILARGKKVILRPLRKETDLEPCVRWFNDPEVTQYLTVYWPLMHQREAAWFDELAKSEDRIVLGIETLKRELVGTVGLHEISARDRTAVLGVVIGEKGAKGKNWDRGLGTDAVMTLLDYAFNTLNLRKVNAGIYAFNGRSLRCAQKCGLRQEGRRIKEVFRNGAYQDVIMLAVFREDWLPISERYRTTDDAK